MKTPEQMAEEYALNLIALDLQSQSQGRESIRDFLAGYKAAQQWISVKERLPEGIGWVTVYGCILSRWAVQPGFYDKEAKEWVSRFICSDETDQGYAPFESVSHWQSRPAPPEEA